MKALRTGLAFLLCLVSLALIGVPQTRGTPMEIALNALWIPLGFLSLRDIYRAGMLSKTPGQIYRATNRPKVLTIEALALLLAAPALVLVTAFAGR